MRVIRYIFWGFAIIALVVVAVHQLTHMTETKSATEPTFQPEFTLANHFGEEVNATTYRGNWSLVFFGFTNCPDICPTTLAEFGRIMDGLGADAFKLKPLFITIDPERDRVADVAKYVSAFHPAIVGLTGTEAQIAEAARSFKAYYEKQPQESAPNGYTMGHTSAVYLISPEGVFVRTYGYGTPPGEITKDLQNRL
ncbi:SCO family protein [Thalassospira sp.]|uniref:SCO family protein n=1 Tax=Thalassospira sp. TaxID=1912094 RepID=UPI001B2514D0|nr:SCO family protein [Thalassospira sp.]MBO6773826.1 SCO family protein [Thalassospira sp.]